MNIIKSPHPKVGMWFSRIAREGLKWLSNTLLLENDQIFLINRIKLIIINLNKNN